MSDLGPMPRVRRSGRECFHQGGRALDFGLLSFWRWSASDLVGNSLRGVLAEYLVAQALGAAHGIREEWASFDLQTPDGTTVEVKSAAYIQSWGQKQFSSIVFTCAKTRAWNSETGLYEEEPRRQAHVYVFALLAHKEQATLDPLDLDQWKFYVVPTNRLDARKRSQHSITLRSLEELHSQPVGFKGLAAAVAEAAGEKAADAPCGEQESTDEASQ